MSTSLYSIVLFVHVLAAVLLVGSSIQNLFVRRAIAAASTVPELISWVGFAHRTTRLNPLFAILLLLSGIYLGAAGWWSAAWFYVSLAVWVMNGSLAGAVVKKNMGGIAQAAAAAGVGEIPSKIDSMRRARSLTFAENAMLANDLVMLYVMLAKPELMECIAILVVAHALAVAAVLLKRADPRTIARQTPSAA